MSDHEHLLVVADDGEPLAMVDVPRIEAAALVLTFALALHSNDEDACQRAYAQALAERGPRGFGYVASVAVRLLATEVLEPTLWILQQAMPQLDLRGKLRDSYDEALEYLAQVNDA